MQNGALNVADGGFEQAATSQRGGQRGSAAKHPGTAFILVEDASCFGYPAEPDERLYFVGNEGDDGRVIRIEHEGSAESAKMPVGSGVVSETEAEQGDR